MSKFTVWRSGSGQLNCWNTLPVCCGEYEADTFLDACVAAANILDDKSWTATIDGGVLYIESNQTNQFGYRIGRYGFFQTQNEAMLFTASRFCTPQVYTDSFGGRYLVEDEIFADSVYISEISQLD